MRKGHKLNNLTNIFFLFVTTLPFCLTVNSQTIASKKYEAVIEQSRKIISDSMTKQNIPDWSVAVAVNEEIVWSEGFGFADLENQVRVTPATRFRIGSVSKVLTADALARLYEQGKIDLDAPVQKYVPDFPTKEQPITVRQLVGNLSGIRHYDTRKLDEAEEDFYRRILSEDFKAFYNDPLLSPPGTKYGYTSNGFTLLSFAIENAAGKDFLTYIREQIFDPLKMKSILADQPRIIVPNRTRFYSLNKEKQVINAVYIEDKRFAAGGFLSTAEDLARFGMANLTDDLLKPETRQLIFTSQKTNDGAEIGIGFGWRIAKDKEGRRIFHHPGSSVGGKAYLLLYPDKKVVVAMLENLTEGTLGVASDIAKKFVDETK